MADDPSHLFREEAIRERNTRLEGEVVLKSVYGVHYYAVGILIIIIAAALWITYGSYARVETVKGVLVSDLGASRVVALRPGVIDRLLADEGMIVKKGQLLATVRTEQGLQRIEDPLQNQLKSLEFQHRLAAQQRTILRQKSKDDATATERSVTGLEAQIADVESQLKLQDTLNETLARTVERMQPIAQRGFISTIDMERKSQDALIAKQESSRLRQQLASLKAERDKANVAIRQGRDELSAQLVDNRSTEETLNIAGNRIHADQSYDIVAPATGEITGLQGFAGKSIDASMPLMTIVPRQGSVHAELFAPSRAAGLVLPYNRVRLLYDAFPYQKFGSFGGIVKIISTTALQPGQFEAPFRPEEPMYRIIVKINQQYLDAYGKRIHLRPGMTLTANIILERRTFLQWLLDPLNAVSMRVHER